MTSKGLQTTGISCPTPACELNSMELSGMRCEMAGTTWQRAKRCGRQEIAEIVAYPKGPRYWYGPNHNSNSLYRNPKIYNLGTWDPLGT